MESNDASTRSLGETGRIRAIVTLLIGVSALLSSAITAAETREPPPKATPIPSFNPRKQPVVPGEFPVGVITITFKETILSGRMEDVLSSLNRVNGASHEADSGASAPRSYATGISQEEYFKIFSNGISWPKIEMMPDAMNSYTDPHFYGYYCEYDYWENPMGWKNREEGAERVGKMNKNALRFAEKTYRGTRPRFLCYNYITNRPATPDKLVTDELRQFYENRGADPDRTRMIKTRKTRKKQVRQTQEFDPWTYYSPVCKWGEPMWPNSKIQINDGAGGVLAHEIGHCLGAPDVYRIGRFNDGIGGSASSLSYGPTSNAFSRFYHHAFIKEKNHPSITTSGTYTLHPRHNDPKGDESVGFLIPSNHPNYMYHVEYIHKESSAVGVGPQVEGMLISAVNLGHENYLGSPDYFYVYRPGDPFFRGLGDTDKCLFGKSHGRTEFNFQTEPSSRLPNLLDGGVSFKNIEEHQGTLTFEVEITRNPVRGKDYTLSMLPQIRLDGITDVQPTSFTMDCTIKFRGEPLKTAYGFCWSTSANPTVRDGTFTLCHREWYRGHAIKLTPDTTYHVRAFATNGLGFRYSDEEKTIKTPGEKSPVESIGPILTDSFSNNRYLFERFSNENPATDGTFIGYSPTCVLAKLIAYYRPERFPTAVEAGSKAAAVDFNRMSWNPGDDDCPPRLDEVDGFFQSVYDQALNLKMHDPKPGKDFLRNLVKLTSVHSKPVVTVLQESNIKEASSLIRKDLAQSRPVIILFSYDSGEITDPIRWCLIDGIDTRGKFHLDVPLNTKLLLDGKWMVIRSGYVPAELLVQKLYKTHVVTSCFYQK
jgi:hypothetical protein